MIFLDLFWTLFKIGAFTFGGGYGRTYSGRGSIKRMGF